jgi:hypothetical protein
MTWQEEMLGAQAYLADRIEKIMCGDPDRYEARGLAAFRFALQDLENELKRLRHRFDADARLPGRVFP